MISSSHLLRKKMKAGDKAALNVHSLVMEHREATVVEGACSSGVSNPVKSPLKDEAGSDLPAAVCEVLYHNTICCII